MLLLPASLQIHNSAAADNADAARDNTGNPPTSAAATAANHRHHQASAVAQHPFAPLATAAAAGTSSAFRDSGRHDNPDSDGSSAWTAYIDATTDTWWGHQNHTAEQHQGRLIKSCYMMLSYWNIRLLTSAELRCIFDTRSCIKEV